MLFPQRQVSYTLIILNSQPSTFLNPSSLNPTYRILFDGTICREILRRERSDHGRVAILRVLRRRSLISASLCVHVQKTRLCTMRVGPKPVLVMDNWGFGFGCVVFFGFERRNWLLLSSIGVF